MFAFFTVSSSFHYFFHRLSVFSRSPLSHAFSLRLSCFFWRAQIILLTFLSRLLFALFIFNPSFLRLPVSLPRLFLSTFLVSSLERKFFSFIFLSWLLFTLCHLFSSICLPLFSSNPPFSRLAVVFLPFSFLVFLFLPSGTDYSSLSYFPGFNLRFLTYFPLFISLSRLFPSYFLVSSLEHKFSTLSYFPGFNLRFFMYFTPFISSCHLCLSYFLASSFEHKFFFFIYLMYSRFSHQFPSIHLLSSSSIRLSHGWLSVFLVFSFVFSWFFPRAQYANVPQFLRLSYASLIRPL